jgi:hypothetical protein
MAFLSLVTFFLPFGTATSVETLKGYSCSSCNQNPNHAFRPNAVHVQALPRGDSGAVLAFTLDSAELGVGSAGCDTNRARAHGSMSVGTTPFTLAKMNQMCIKRSR